jgi:xylose isomerase
MDVCARALLAAERIIQDGELTRIVHDRYTAWRAPFGRDILSGKTTLEGLATHVLSQDHDVAPISGRQEYLENLFSRFC